MVLKDMGNREVSLYYLLACTLLILKCRVLCDHIMRFQFNSFSCVFMQVKDSHMANLLTFA